MSYDHRQPKSHCTCTASFESGKESLQINFQESKNISFLSSTNKLRPNKNLNNLTLGNASSQKNSNLVLKKASDELYIGDRTIKKKQKFLQTSKKQTPLVKKNSSVITTTILPKETVMTHKEDASRRNKITNLDDLSLYTEDKIPQWNSEMTISSIVRELVFHDKATIRHRRYCILCERWFPTTLRHRRHLAGYQHRHTELTQRRAIHILFLIFTGKLCPKLLPPNVLRDDCVPGELTPLQIAVQDFTMVFNATKLAMEKQNKELINKI